jgi:hypothetical protein
VANLEALNRALWNEIVALVHQNNALNDNDLNDIFKRLEIHNDMSGVVSNIDANGSMVGEEKAEISFLLFSNEELSNEDFSVADAEKSIVK